MGRAYLDGQVDVKGHFPDHFPVGGFPPQVVAALRYSDMECLGLLVACGQEQEEKQGDEA